MALTRISDQQAYAFFSDRAGRLQVSIQALQEQIASGRRLHAPEDNPLGAADATRIDTSLAALGQYEESSRFGVDVLGAQDSALGEAGQVLVRAEEIATQQATNLLGPDEREAAREEVHGLLQALTAIGNDEYAGRRIFGGLALEAPQPFADPDTPGYSAATAYGGSTQDFWVKVGSGPGERVRVSSRGDTVFQRGLQALQDLETALATGGNVAATLDDLAAGRGDVQAERASVGARQANLIGRVTQVRGVVAQQEQARSRVVDADLAKVVSQLVQAQAALEALFTAQPHIVQTSLVNLLQP
jgi:flagellar hook-associated protein 3 FlgL